MESTATLRELSNRPRVDKFAFYRALTGKELGADVNFGEIHPVDIRPEEMDDAYLAAKNLQRRYNNPILLQRPGSTDSYLHPNFVAIDIAYSSGKLDELKAAVEGLLKKLVKW